MADFLAFLVVLAGFAVIMGVLAWLASRTRRRRGVGGAVMGAVDEVFRPSAHRFRIEIRVQEERRLPISAPDGQ